MDEFEKEIKEDFLEEAEQILDEIEAAFLEYEKDSGNKEVLESLFRCAHNLKGSGRAVGFGDIAEFTHELEDLLVKIKNGEVASNKVIVDLLLESNDCIKQMIDELKLNLEARFDNAALIQRLKEAQQGVLQEHAPANVMEESKEEPAPADSVEKVQKPPEPEKKANVDESIRVPLSRIEKLNDFVGELVIMHSVLKQQGQVDENAFKKSINQVEKITKEIQDISMGLRMLPIKNTFSKMQRIVRDTSKTLNKQVNLTIKGEETEVDKTILEHIADPLVHIVRNAIDHGLEENADREKLNKSFEGNVTLAAFHEGSNLVIEVKDDGKGLDPDNIIYKAIEKGVIKSSEGISKKEALQLIFKPGFSTKDTASEVSGRGVGMDVVKTNINRLSGDIVIDSEVGKGTTFKIVLPLTLSIIDGMVTLVGQHRFILPVSQISETLQADKQETSFISGGGYVLNLRGDTIPLVQLSSSLSLTQEESAGLYRDKIAVISSSMGNPFALLVDDIVAKQQVVVKNIGQEVENKENYSGVSILGDGMPSLIVDLNAVFKNNRGISNINLKKTGEVA